MLPGHRDDVGQLHVVLGGPAGTSPRLGGIALTDTDRVFYATVVSDNFVNGNMVSDDGQLILDTVGAVTNFHGGVGRTATGAIAAVIDGSPLATDSVVNNLRCTADGKLMVTTVLP